MPVFLKIRGEREEKRKSDTHREVVVMGKFLEHGSAD